MVEMRGRFEVHRLADGTEIFFDPKPHRYYGEIKKKTGKAGEDGDNYSFVRSTCLTGISGFGKAFDLDVDPLLWWASRLTREGIAQLADIAMEQGWPLDFLRDADHLDEQLRENELRWVDVRDAAAVAGTNVHEMIFSGERPDLSTLTEVERGFGRAALRWLVDRKPEVLQAETVTADVSLGVAGRFDLRCKVDGEVWLVDAKTREGGRTRKGDHIQLAGYEHCNVTCGVGPSDRRVALILKPDGTYAEFEGQADQNDFLAAVQTTRLSRALDKRLKDARPLNDPTPPF